MSKTRVALCLYGKVGNIKGKSGDSEVGADVVLQLAHKHWYEYLMRKNNVDVFIWSWDGELKPMITTLFNPVKQEYKEQINFLNRERKLAWGPRDENEKSRVQNHYSRYYSLQKCVGLKSQYELENNFKYDIVFCSRFDLCLKKKIVPNVWSEFISKNDKAIIGNGGPVWRTRSKIQDHYFFSSSQNMDKFATLYDTMNSVAKIPKLKGGHGISGHRLCKHHILDYLGLRLHSATIETDKEKVDLQEASVVRALYFNWHRRGAPININPKGRLTNIKLIPNTPNWETFEIENK